MQLDRTRITVRERNYLDLLDLAVTTVRAHAGALLLTSLLGAVPMIFLNIWLLDDWLREVDWEFDEVPPYSYLWRLAWVTLLEMPLAAAPTTLYLGQAVFLEKPSVKQIAIDLMVALPQFLLFQIVPRALAVIPAVATGSPLAVFLGVMLLLGLLFVNHAIWPYLSEVVLLERNALRKPKHGGFSTLGRVKNLHVRATGELFGRWLLAAFFAMLWIWALWSAVSYLRDAMLGVAEDAISSYTIHLQAAVWIVISFFSVVRFLSYIDLRIRNEGWEIELRMRAEGERLSRQVV